MKTFEEWCQDREIVLNELSPIFVAMAYKIWGEDCFVEGQRHEAENAALRERLSRAVELPRTEISPYDSNDTMLYYIEAGHIQQECFNNKFPEQLQARLAELNGGSND